MPPAKTRPQTQRPLSTMEAFPAPPATRTIPIATGDDENSTPKQRVAMKPKGITQGQKQALLDNLQLEITERARKLRAQYALQAQGLRTRLEMRVNRIPSALRKRNIQDLLNEHAEKLKPVPPPSLPITAKPAQMKPEVISRYTVKRKSDQISIDDDKENASVQTTEDLANPKKRTKNVGPVAKVARTASKKGGPTGVLSPRSHNSRTMQRSPVKSALSPRSHNVSRAIGSPVKTAPTKSTTRAPTRQTKRTVSQEERSSDASNMSTGTTIVHKPATKKATTTRKPPVPKATTTKKPAVKKETAAPAASTGRTLRKRT
ncbi:Hypothetical protein R9X50_00286200 [Acrodontium crateriforme]|uniref:Borealin N-terminal domain-containing protein n=1 Tax=Acrodontium crateriforme TaxID=150365 RepID=A0AAQ3M2F8_9PEZI|nr:Hypothetical protein R9X50_00286200 [Acrodontium crateriforme]